MGRWSWLPPTPTPGFSSLGAPYLTGLSLAGQSNPHLSACEVSAGAPSTELTGPGHMDGSTKGLKREQKGRIREEECSGKFWVGNHWKSFQSGRSPWLCESGVAWRTQAVGGARASVSRVLVDRGRQSSILTDMIFPPSFLFASRNKRWDRVVPFHRV